MSAFFLAGQARMSFVKISGDESGGPRTGAGPRQGFIKERKSSVV